MEDLTKPRNSVTMGHNPVIQLTLEEPCINWMLLRVLDTGFQKGFGHRQTGKLDNSKYLISTQSNNLGRERLAQSWRSWLQLMSTLMYVWRSCAWCLSHRHYVKITAWSLKISGDLFISVVIVHVLLKQPCYWGFMGASFLSKQTF